MAGGRVWSLDKALCDADFSRFGLTVSESGDALVSAGVWGLRRVFRCAVGKVSRGGAEW